MICDKCGKYFEDGNYPDGTPNGIKAILKDGRELTVCHDCIISFSTPAGKQWLEGWKEGMIADD